MDKDDDSKIFPQRLMEILADKRCEGIIEWLPHGRAFLVRDRSLFAEKVMPLYFSRHAKYSSFTRKLNRWNFVRVSSGPELGAYYHEFFLRDKPQLAAQMFCKNARSKLAMSEECSSGPKPVPSPETPHAVSPRATTPPSPPANIPQLPQQQQQPYTLPADIPLGLLELLSKGPMDVDMAAPSSGAPVPSRFLQQSQYANLLLERQIQILQREQAKLMLVREAMVVQHQQQQNNDTLEQQRHKDDEDRLCKLMDIKLHQSKGRAPTNHRASAA